MKHGTVVHYDGKDGTVPLAIFLSGDPDGKANIATMNKGGVWEIQEDAGRDDDGGGHTFRPV